MDTKTYASLVKLGKKMAYTYHANADDFISIAVLEGIEAEAQYRDVGSSKSTYILARAKNRLIKETKKLEVVEYGEYMDPETTTPETLYLIQEILESISEEAREVLEILFESPGELWNLARGKGKLMRGLLKKKARENGFTIDLWESASRELRQVLKELKNVRCN